MVETIIKSAKLSPSGRKQFTSEQKAGIVSGWESSGLSCAEFCRKYGLISSQLYKWRHDAKTGAVMGIRNEGSLHSKAEISALIKENEELKKALGEAALDIKILKKSWSWTNNEAGG
jgi:transposase-like protein